jgi:hypothetical protein
MLHASIPSNSERWMLSFQGIDYANDQQANRSPRTPQNLTETAMSRNLLSPLIILAAKFDGLVLWQQRKAGDV